MTEKSGRLTIAAERGGAITEISQFLADLEGAYVALYRVDVWGAGVRRLRRMPIDSLYVVGYPLTAIGMPAANISVADEIPPRDRLTLERVRIESPGLWEFLASLNPLQQIREYLNDRHRRRQDREFREAAEKDKLLWENELIKHQVLEKENSILRDRITILRDLGYADAAIDRFIWTSIGAPLSRLGRHQDTGLIGAADHIGNGGGAT